MAASGEIKGSLYTKIAALLYNDELSPQLISLEIINNSEADINIPKRTDSISLSHYHFRLQFRPDTLLADYIKTIQLENQNWDFLIDTDHDNVFLCLLNRFEAIKLPPKTELIFHFSNVIIDPSKDGRMEKVGLEYDNLVDNNNNTIKGSQILQVKKSSGTAGIQKQQPFRLSFFGGNTVLNDGSSVNELTLCITNVLSEAIVITADTKLLLTFDEGDICTSLGNSDTINAYQVEAGTVINSQWRKDLSWKINKDTQGQFSVWTITYDTMKSGNQDFTLEPRQNIALKIRNIITGNPTGMSSAYISYKNIPGYENDTQYAVIQKQPLIFEHNKVGIGVVHPAAALQIKGEIMDSTGSTVPRGAILMWSGDRHNIPVGWAVCDGTNGTPDLRDRFIVGVGNQYKEKDAGGQDKVVLNNAQMPRHSHTGTTINDTGHYHLIEASGHVNLPDSVRNFQGNATLDIDLYPDAMDTKTGRLLVNTSSDYCHTYVPGKPDYHKHDLKIDFTGEAQAHENRPPYYALCFIMKL